MALLYRVTQRKDKVSDTRFAELNDTITLFHVDVIVFGDSSHIFQKQQERYY